MTSEEKLVLGLLVVAAFLYFSGKAKADVPAAPFVPGGANEGFHGVTGSWLSLREPLL